MALIAGAGGANDLVAAGLAAALGAGVSGPGTQKNVQLSIQIADAGRAPLHVDSQGGIHGTRATTGIQTFSNIDDAIASWFLMDDGYQKRLQEQMFALGLIDGPNRTDQAAGVWQDAVKFSWNYKVAGKDISPIDMLGRMTNLKAAQNGNSPRTQTNKSYQYMNPDGAKALARNAFQQAVGRDPTDAELRSMAGAIIDGYKKQPDVTTSTTTTDATGNSNTSTTTQQGFDAQAYIANQLNADPEARAHQAAAELYPALIQAIQSPV